MSYGVPIINYVVVDIYVDDVDGVIVAVIYSFIGDSVVIVMYVLCMVLLMLVWLLLLLFCVLLSVLLVFSFVIDIASDGVGCVVDGDSGCGSAVVVYVGDGVAVGIVLSVLVMLSLVLFILLSPLLCII